MVAGRLGWQAQANTQKRRRRRRRRDGRELAGQGRAAVTGLAAAAGAPPSGRLSHNKPRAAPNAAGRAQAGTCHYLQVSNPSMDLWTEQGTAWPARPGAGQGQGWCKYKWVGGCGWRRGGDLHAVGRPGAVHSGSKPRGPAAAHTCRPTTASGQPSSLPVLEQARCCPPGKESDTPPHSRTWRRPHVALAHSVCLGSPPSHLAAQS